MALRGADHLAMSVAHISAADSAMEQLGHVRLFVDTGLANHAAKTACLSRWRPLHDIALFRGAGGGLSIEATAHGQVVANSGQGYVPLVEMAIPPDAAPLDSMDDLCRNAEAAFGGAVTALCWPDTDARVLVHAPVGNGAVHARIRAVIAAVDAMEAEAQFWCALGFSVVRDPGADWVLLRLIAPLPSLSVDLLLCRSDVPNAATLDSAGFPCLAFLSSPVAEQMVLAESAGGKSVGQPFCLTVNGRPLEIGIFRSPGGLLGEFIHPGRRVSS